MATSLAAPRREIKKSKFSDPAGIPAPSPRLPNDRTIAALDRGDNRSPKPHFYMVGLALGASILSIVARRECLLCCPAPSSHPDHDLPEMRARSHVAVGGRGVVEAEHLVDDRLDGGDLDGAVHRHEHLRDRKS